MSSELSPREKRILERYLARQKNADTSPIKPPRIQPPTGDHLPLNIEALLATDKIYLSEDTDSDGNYIGVPIALENALTEVSSMGVASMPYLIAGNSAANRDRKYSANSHWLWKDWFTCYSEENVIIDSKGLFGERGKPVVFVVHRGGILTPERIKRAYSGGLTPQNAAKYTSDETNGLLEGKLPNGKQIQIYTVDDVKKGNVSNPFGQYAVVVNFETAKATKSDYHSKDDFKNNELVIARAGTLDYLDEYFEKAQSGNTVGNWHRFTEIDPNQPQGRLLFLDGSNYGLDGDDNLDNDGRFVGVAPEAHGARK
ncbi:hypothetical protein ACFLZN_01415 [Nanoarchaeota archaeon]